MKNRKILLLLAFTNLLALTSYAQAQENLPATAPRPIKYILKLVPQEFIVNTFRVDLEVKTGKRSSLQISPSFTSAQNSTEFDDITGGGADLTAKFYLQKEGAELKGFYGGLNGSFHSYSINDNYSRSGPNATYNTNHHVTRLGANLVLGYQFIFQEIVALDLYAGGGIRASRTKEEIDPQQTFIFPDPRYRGIAPKVGFSVGIIL